METLKSDMMIDSLYNEEQGEKNKGILCENRLSKIGYLDRYYKVKIKTKPTLFIGNIYYTNKYTLKRFSHYKGTKHNTTKKNIHSKNE